MGITPLQPHMEFILEWTLFLAVGASGLCMLALVTVLIVTRYRVRLKRK